MCSFTKTHTALTESFHPENSSLNFSLNSPKMPRDIDALEAVPDAKLQALDKAYLVHISTLTNCT